MFYKKNMQENYFNQVFKTRGVPLWVFEFIRGRQPVEKNEKFNQFEAFCHMFYFSDKPGVEPVRVWNSRDKVTPFIIIYKGNEYQHKFFQLDRREEDYKPQKGELIFRDYTEEEAEIAAKNRINGFKNTQFELTPDSERYNLIFKNLKEEFIKSPKLAEV